MRNWRTNLILGFIFLFGALIISNLFLIQIVRGDFYKALAQGLSNVSEEKTFERGEIFFKKGEPLAINLEQVLVFASPKQITEKEETAEKLAGILGIDKDLILEKLKKDNLYEVLKKKLADEEAAAVKELSLEGIYLAKEITRYYPQETLSSQLVGFLDAEGQGQYGLEHRYDEFLQPKRKSQGEDLVLTIDYSIQFTAEKLLEEAEQNLGIESGGIIVMEPATGKILALANFPNFNPNQYSGISDFDIFQNSLTQKIFEPGSVFKPITMAAALEEEKITPQTTYLDPGVIEFDGWPIYNYEQRIYRGEATPEITMTEVLEKSVNTGAVFAEQQLGRELFFEYIGKFGFFEETGIDIQETVPENKELYEARKRGREINFATAAYGQGIEMTPIQLIKAYSVIANGGRLVKPYIVDEIRGENDRVLITQPEIEEELVISSKNTSQLTAMLINVVEQGFAKSAQVQGYYVAGKTGTAQVPEGGTYSSEKSIQSFIGFAPAFNPQFLIIIKLDNPKTKTAEYSAVPIFHDLAKYIINYYQIPPDYE